MARHEPLNLSSTLRRVQAPIIHVECRKCGRTDSFPRTEIVKKHGASITFARLRRVMAMGCSKLCGPSGDQCGTRFPCLDENR